MKNIPILMVTSVNDTVLYAFEPDETWLRVDVFIGKPIMPQQQLEQVSRMLSV